MTSQVPDPDQTGDSGLGALVGEIAPESAIVVGDPDTASLKALADVLTAAGCVVRWLSPGDVRESALGEGRHSGERSVDEDTDLVVVGPSIRHLDPEDGDAALLAAASRARYVLVAEPQPDFDDPAARSLAMPEHWSRLLARAGLIRDLGAGAGPHALYQRRAGGWPAVVEGYERELRVSRQAAEARRRVAVESREVLAGAWQRIEALKVEVAEKERLRRKLMTAELERDEARRRASLMEAQVLAWEERWSELEGTWGWQVVTRLQALRAALAPPGSIREQTLIDGVAGLTQGDPGRWGQALGRLIDNVAWHLRRPAARRERRARMAGGRGALRIQPVPPRPDVPPRSGSVDVVVCVHNALEDVRRCLTALSEGTEPPVRLILVDDGSDAETAEYVAEVVADDAGMDAVLIRNESARGYTFAANQGLRASTADFVVLLNSDTEVSPGWLDRLVACGTSHPAVGLAGPLSNTATWQSVPQVADGGDWAANPLPAGLTVAGMAELVDRHAARSYPRLPILNGFCLLIRREVLDAVGTFDEATFAAGYGEENDYCLRAGEAGFELAVADDAYVFHAQGRSYTDERRKALSLAANETLLTKHPKEVVDAAVQELSGSRVMAGIRAHTAVLPERGSAVEAGRRDFAGRRVLFALPSAGAGGGAVHVVFTARVLRRMGVDVGLFNLASNRPAFEEGFPDLDIPVTYGEPEDLGDVAADYDAAVATAHFTVPWLVTTFHELPDLVRGYLIQDYEPFFYQPASSGDHAARTSYGLIPDLVRITTTRWVRDELDNQQGLASHRCGAAIDVDLFRPRPRTTPDWPDRPLRIAAMVRPESSYRGPARTMRVLAQLDAEFGDEVEILIYGTTRDNSGFRRLPHSFSHELLGPLSQREMAFLFNEIDVFLDFSDYQAFGMAAVEAMSCGVACVVPAAGGTGAYARHGETCLTVDTNDEAACLAAARDLVTDDGLRSRIQAGAMWEGPRHHPEGPAYRLLAALFES